MSLSLKPVTLRLCTCLWLRWPQTPSLADGPWELQPMGPPAEVQPWPWLGSPSAGTRTAKPRPQLHAGPEGAQPTWGSLAGEAGGRLTCPASRRHRARSLTSVTLDDTLLLMGWPCHGHGHHESAAWPCLVWGAQRAVGVCPAASTNTSVHQPSALDAPPSRLLPVRKSVARRGVPWPHRG